MSSITYAVTRLLRKRSSIFLKSPAVNASSVNSPHRTVRNASALSHAYTEQQQQRTPTLPTELLDFIVSFALSDNHAYSSISGFSRACRRFRQVALRWYYSQLHIQSQKRWAAAHMLQGATEYAKHLDVTADAMSISPSSITHFQSLLTLKVTFFGQNFGEQHRSVPQLASILPTSLTELRLTDLTHIDKFTLTAIGARLVNLVTLDLSRTERLDESCCWACFEESSTCLWHSPIPDVFPNATHLVHHLRTSFRPLTKLQHLHLGFFLSSRDLLEYHIYHGQEVFEDETPPFGPEVCPLCCKKFSAEVRLTELAVTLHLAQTLRTLESVKWSSFFGKSKEDIMDRKTCVHIYRKDGRVKVRRRPW